MNGPPVVISPVLPPAGTRRLTLRDTLAIMPTSASDTLAEERRASQRESDRLAIEWDMEQIRARKAQQQQDKILAQAAAQQERILQETARAAVIAAEAQRGITTASTRSLQILTKRNLTIAGLGIAGFIVLKWMAGRKKGAKTRSGRYLPPPEFA